MEDYVFCPDHFSGAFIALEGPDGAGKSTLAEGLAGWLRKSGVDVVLTQSPSRVGLGPLIRTALSGACGDVHPRVMSALFSADRASVSEGIREALSRGACVLVDRWSEANLVYQGCRKPGMTEDQVLVLEALEHLDLGVLRPDVTLFVTVPGAVCDAVLSEKELDVLEADMGLRVAVREEYARRAACGRGRLLRCFGSDGERLSREGCVMEAVRTAGSWLSRVRPSSEEFRRECAKLPRGLRSCAEYLDWVAMSLGAKERYFSVSDTEVNVLFGSLVLTGRAGGVSYRLADCEEVAAGRLFGLADMGAMLGSLGNV